MRGILIGLVVSLGLGACGAKPVTESSAVTPGVTPNAPATSVAGLDSARLGETEAAAVAQARVVLANHLQLPEHEIEAANLHEVSAQQWPSASLGCAKPGEYSAQVITDGYRVVLLLAGKRYQVHTGRRGGRLCDKLPSIPR